MTAKKTITSKPKTPPRRGFFLPKDLLSIKELSHEQIRAILNLATRYKSLIASGGRFPSGESEATSSLPDGGHGGRAVISPRLEDLKGKTVINLFFEPSTRTRTSFEIAARRLSADLLTITPQGTSLSKGEGLKDMVENLEAMRPDLIVVRHAASGVPGLLAKYTRASVINAGDGSHEHPTQALLDLFTVQEILRLAPAKPDASAQRGGRIPILHPAPPIGATSFKGLHLVIVGDLAYSRVARSNIYAFKKMGARVTCVGPATLLPPGLESLGVRVSSDLDRELPEADAVMLLRIQKERQEKMNFPSLAEYTRFFGLSKERFRSMKKDALIMHPGPINRGVEIDPDVADGLFPDGPKTVILDQVKNGIPVRMAVLAAWASLKREPR